MNDPFDLDALLDENPGWVTSFVVSKKVELADGGYACCGEGSWGSEGFFARLSPNGEPVWVVYLERSNPFIEVDVRDQAVRFRSSSGVTVSVTLMGAGFAPTRWPAAPRPKLLACTHSTRATRVSAESITEWPVSDI